MMTELEMIITLGACGYKIEKLPLPEKPFNEMTEEELSSAEYASFIELKRAHQIASTMMWRINDIRAEHHMREIRKPRRAKSRTKKIPDCGDGHEEGKA